MDTLLPLPDWPRAHGIPAGRGSIRTRVEDFQVDELSAVEASGEGEHLWLRLEKQGENTAWVARQLARAAGIRERDVGYAGRKDRHSVARQLFSLSVAGDAAQQVLQAAIPGVRILEHWRHSRKLKRGALTGNRFQIVLRQLDGDPAGLEERFARLVTTGVPNYFAEQRFGIHGQNLARALLLLSRKRRFPRHLSNIYCSAARSYFFNQVLAERVRDGSWNQLIEGDLAQLAGRRAIFPATSLDAELAGRCAALEIHPTGPLPGAGQTSSGRCLELEQRVLAAHPGWLESLQSAGLEASRRSLRLALEKAALRIDDDCLTVSFELPAGGFATAVLRELVDYHDVQSRRHTKAGELQ